MKTLLAILTLSLTLQACATEWRDLTARETKGDYANCGKCPDIWNTKGFDQEAWLQHNQFHACLKANQDTREAEQSN